MMPIKVNWLALNWIAGWCDEDAWWAEILLNLVNNCELNDDANELYALACLGYALACLGCQISKH